MIATLIEDVRNYLTHLNDDFLNIFLNQWPVPGNNPQLKQNSTLPVLAWLADMVNAAEDEQKTIAKQLSSSASDLLWCQTYSPEDFGIEFLDRYGWTELIGNRGVIYSNHMACGFLLLGTEIEYPSHRHEAAEVYIPLTGQTFWMCNNDEWVSRKAGIPIYHEPCVPHAIKTHTLPLLAIYIWKGNNLTQKSLID